MNNIGLQTVNILSGLHMTPWKRERSSSDGDNSEDHSSESDSDETELQEQRGSSSDQEESSVTSKESSDNADNINDSSDEESDVPESVKDLLDLVIKRPTNKSNANSPKNHLKKLKCDLKSSMKLSHDSTNSGDFATSGLLSDADLPNIPLIEVNG